MPVNARAGRLRRPVLLALLALGGAGAHKAHAQEPGGWVLTPRVSIGQENGPPEYTFARIATVAAASDGTIFVLDAGDHRVRAYDAAGRHLTTFGRQGSGPGEFQGAGRMIVDSLVYVFDGPQQRYSAFSHSGEHLRTERLPSPPGTALAGLIPLRHGLWLGTRAARMSLGHPSHDPNHGVVLLHPGGRTDSVAAYHSGATLWHLRGATVPWGIAEAEFGAGGAAGVHGDSLVATADGYAGVVRWFRVTPAGLAPVRARRMNIGSEPVTRADLRAVERRLVERRRRTSGSIGPVELIAPARWSVASAMLFANDGSLWVRNRTTAEGEVWMVFDPEGTVVGRPRLPAGFHLHAVRGTELYGVAATAAGAPVVRVYRLERIPGG
jgi:hypothetical protein